MFVEADMTVDTSELICARRAWEGRRRAWEGDEGQGRVTKGRGGARDAGGQRRARTARARAAHLRDRRIVRVQPLGGDAVERRVVEHDDGVGVEREPLEREQRVIPERAGPREGSEG